MKNYPSRLMFLDFDGCVTSEQDGTYFCPDPKKYHASKQIITRIRKFCRTTGTKVVVSSNWRKFEPDGVWKTKYGVFANPLKGFIRALDDCYFDTLSPERHIKKAQSLILWMEDNPGFSGEFVIFDDDIREEYQTTCDYGINRRFIHVNSYTGITDFDLEKAKEILNGK